MQFNKIFWVFCIMPNYILFLNIDWKNKCIAKNKGDIEMKN